MSANLEIRGLEELKQALAKLPAELKGTSTAIVLDAAHSAQADIVAQYPHKTGKLQRGVKVKVQEIGPHGIAAQVRSSAPHNWLYEYGTEVRHYITKNHVWHNTGRMWGKTPPTPVFIPTMMRHRRTMYAKLATLLRATGLTVHEG